MAYLNLEDMLAAKRAKLEEVLAATRKTAQAMNELTVLQLELKASIETIETIMAEAAKDQT